MINPNKWPTLPTTKLKGGVRRGELAVTCTGIGKPKTCTSGLLKIIEKSGAGRKKGVVRYEP